MKIKVIGILLILLSFGLTANVNAKQVEFLKISYALHWYDISTRDWNNMSNWQFRHFKVRKAIFQCNIRVRMGNFVGNWMPNHIEKQLGKSHSLYYFWTKIHQMEILHIWHLNLFLKRKFTESGVLKRQDIEVTSWYCFPIAVYAEQIDYLRY